MKSEKIIAAISKAGSVILTTVLSFVVLPPSVDGDDGIVNWKSIFCFFAGVLSIICYDRWKKNKRSPNFSFVLLAILIISAGVYQVIYNAYTVKCFDKISAVVSTAPVKSDAQEKSIFWHNHSQKPIQAMLEANNAKSLVFWSMAELAVAYYSMLAIYFLIIITVVLLLVSVSDQIKKPL